jgi:hypothetical protein
MRSGWMLASVHCTELNFLTCHRPRCSVLFWMYLTLLDLKPQILRRVKWGLTLKLSFKDLLMWLRRDWLMRTLITPKHFTAILAHRTNSCGYRTVCSALRKNSVLFTTNNKQHSIQSVMLHLVFKFHCTKMTVFSWQQPNRPTACPIPHQNSRIKKLLYFRPALYFQCLSVMFFFEKGGINFSV